MPTPRPLLESLEWAAWGVWVEWGAWVVEWAEWEVWAVWTITATISSLWSVAVCSAKQHNGASRYKKAGLIGTQSSIHEVLGSETSDSDIEDLANS